MNTTAFWLACAFSILAAILFQNDVEAQVAEANYDESKIPAYTLPDPLRAENGDRITSRRAWERKRRPEVLSLFETHVYGRSPEARKPRWEILSNDTGALGGRATRRQVRIFLTGDMRGPAMDLLMYLPTLRTGAAPAFLGLNFNGNHSIHSDPGILLPQSWLANDREGTVVGNRATEKGRGKAASRWPVETILERGYALATIHYSDIEPDFADGWETGLRTALRPSHGGASAPASGGRKGAPPDAAADDWGSIAAWSWGLSRALDYLEQDQEVDARKVALLGHSRLGKTSLWAGARDERFAIVISNNSGCGGAALSRRAFGETVHRINTSFPHWFCGNFQQYNSRESALPVDQHQLIALIAPRPVYVASAEEDRWADPKGEFLGAQGADPVYALYGKNGLGVKEMPGLHQPAGDLIGYHIRAGQHDVTEYDWEQYLNFADRHFSKRRK